MKLLTTTLFLLVLSSIPSFGQNLICGTTAAETPGFDIQDYANFMENYNKQATSRSNQTIDTVHVKLFMVWPEVANIADKKKILKAIEEINKQTIEANFVFYIEEENIGYITDNQFYVYDGGLERDSLRKLYNDKRALEMYVVNEIGRGGVAGFSTGSLLDGGFVVLKRVYLSTGLVAHELGHSLSLKHTHGRFNSNVENCMQYSYPASEIPEEVHCQGAVRYDDQPDLDDNMDDIADCLQTGDGVCDTRAEPVLNQPDMMDGCDYIGTVTDYYGDLYNPDIGNFMSYADSSCNYFFTDGQIGKMRYHLNEYLACNCSKQNSPIATVTSTEEEGKGTLREAITCLNYCEKLNKINFDLLEKDSILYINYLPILYGTASIDGLTKFGTRMILDGDSWSLGLWLSGKSFQVQNLNIRSCSFSGLIAIASENISVETSNP